MNQWGKLKPDLIQKDPEEKLNKGYKVNKETDWTCSSCKTRNEKANPYCKNCDPEEYEKRNWKNATQ